MQKYLDFTIRIYSQQTLFIIDKLISHKSTIRFFDLLTHVINYITSLITLCSANNIKFAKLESIITTGCAIISDYISISKEECISNLAYESKYTDAILFALQKVTNSFGLEDRNVDFLSSSFLNNETRSGIHIIKSSYLAILSIMLNNPDSGLELRIFKPVAGLLLSTDDDNVLAKNNKLLGRLKYNLHIVEKYLSYIASHINGYPLCIIKFNTALGYLFELLYVNNQSRPADISVLFAIIMIMYGINSNRAGIYFVEMVVNYINRVGVPGLVKQYSSIANTKLHPALQTNCNPMLKPPFKFNSSNIGTVETGVYLPESNPEKKGLEFCVKELDSTPTELTKLSIKILLNDTINKKIFSEIIS